MIPGSEPTHPPCSGPVPPAERMRNHRRRRRWRRLNVRIDLGPADIDALVKRGYLEPEAREDLRSVQDAADAFISDALGNVVTM
jgi:hypothetical protein